MSKIKKLKSIRDIMWYTRLFNKAIGYSNVPWKYHATGDVYASLDDSGRIVGGFTLIGGYFNLRAVLQMPEDIQRDFYEKEPKMARNMCDLTGYFILNPKNALNLTIWLVLVCLFSKYKYFIYTYPTKDTGLERYYGIGDPLRIHTGIPEKLPGHSDHMEEEHVEVLTKWGIIRIFLYRTKRIFKSKK